MLEITVKTYLIICPLVFFSGFIDSIAGGGGLISLPAYMLAGLPVHLAQGTNKLVAIFGMLLSAAQYGRGGYLRMRPALVAAAGSLIGGAAGARSILAIPEEKAQLFMIIALPCVALFLLTRKSTGSDTDNIVEAKKEYFRGFFVGLGSGFYAGFVGAGGGTIMIMLFGALLGYSMIRASANAKIVNLASDIGALAAFAMGGHISIAIGLPSIVCCCLGNFVGSRMAMKRGSKFIRPLMIAVMTAVFVRVVYNFIVGG